MNTVPTKIISVGELLAYERLSIPEYQRPYKWTSKNVNQLINDIFTHKDKSAYRLGTIVIHEDKNEYKIVDGQQRTLTLLLIVKAILAEKTENVKNHRLKEQINKLREMKFNPRFKHETSFQNIHNNYKEIIRQVARFDEELIGFLLNKCEFVQFILNDVSEAFQFFDSQNARGRDLEPHDLLKAYHLREFAQQDKALKTQVVDTWENMPTKQLSDLFAEYLFRIKNWSKGKSARYFTKDNVDLFKGINFEQIDNYPYTNLLRISHFFVDGYNEQYERKIDLQQMSYPFQLDQPIINGRRFFEMITHYKGKIDILLKSIESYPTLNEMAKNIISKLNSYDGRFRTGDKYVRMIFNCALIYYVDKFGDKDISKAIEKIFIWAYSVRLNQQVVQLATVDNYVLYQMNLFKRIQDVNHHTDILTIYLKNVDKNNSTKTETIQQLFTQLHYFGK